MCPLPHSRTVICDISFNAFPTWPPTLSRQSDEVGIAEWMTQRNTSCLPQCLTTPNTNIGGWWLSCPWPCQIPLRLLPTIRNVGVFPSPTMKALPISWRRSVCFRWFKRNIASRQFLHSREACQVWYWITHSFDLYQPIKLVYNSWVS